MAKKQTAVDWLVEQIENGNIEIIYSDKIHSIKCIPVIVDQAKEMEKQQIMDAFHDGCQFGYNQLPYNCEEYYKENYDQGTD